MVFYPRISLSTGTRIKVYPSGYQMLSNQALNELKEVFKEETGQEVSDEFAMEQGINLLTMFDSIYRPVKTDWLYEQTLSTFNKLSLELQMIAKDYLTLHSTESLCESL